MLQSAVGTPGWMFACVPSITLKDQESEHIVQKTVHNKDRGGPALTGGRTEWGAIGRVNFDGQSQSTSKRAG